MRAMIFSSLISLLLVCLGCGVTEWQTFAPAGGKCKIQMPGKPKSQSQDVGGTTMNVFGVDTGDGAYMLAYMDMPIAEDETPEQIQQRLIGAQQGMITNVGAKLISAKKVTLNSIPGREIIAEVPSKSAKMHGKIFIHKKRLYQVLVVGKGNLIESEEARKFLASLSIIK